MIIVGLTGGIGSGKTTVANFFAAYKNVAIYVTDVEAKKLMNASKIIKQKITATFGKDAYIDDATLNRKYIADIVFKNKQKLSELNAIVHPEVKNHFQEFIKQNIEKDYIIYENAILFESKSHLKCDVIITVYADLETKINRVISRDSCSRQEVLNRMKNQWNDEKKMHQSNYIIFNNSLDETQNQVHKIHHILTEKF